MLTQPVGTGMADTGPTETLRILVAQIGARRHYAVPAALQAAGVLERLVTTGCAAHPLIRAATVIPSRWRPAPLSRMVQRAIAGVPTTSVTSTLSLDLRRWSGPGTAEGRYLGYVWQNRAFGRYVCRRGFGQASAVYGFNAAAVEIFEEARGRGLRCFLDQTMAPFACVETLLAEERRRWPDWEDDVAPEAWRGLDERERREWDLADVILCGSPFVVESIAACGGPAHKCRIAEYGYPRTAHPPVPRGLRPEDPSLHVLFAGTLCLRKGFPYMLEAARRLAGTSITFRAVGPSEIRPAALSRAREVVDVRGAVPRAAMADHYAWADVLVVPSLAEGSANVAQEALSAGVPVIATNAAGTQVKDGISGMIIPARDTEALVEAIRAYQSDRVLWQSHSERARELQASSASAEDYAGRLLSAMAGGRTRDATPLVATDSREPRLT